MRRLSTVFVAVFVAVAFGACGVTSSSSPDEPAAVGKELESNVVLDPGELTTAAVAVSQAVFAQADVAALVCSSETDAPVSRFAVAHTVPLLVATEEVCVGGEASENDQTGVVAELEPLVAEELLRLGVSHLLVSGAEVQMDEHVTVHKITDADESTWPSLEEFALPVENIQSFAAVTEGSSSQMDAVLAAAGADGVHSPRDVRASAETIEKVSSYQHAIVAFSEPGSDVQWQLAAAQSGQQLPGGGQLVFEGKRYVALYGTPSTSALGVLGEQGVEETVARAADMANAYQPLTDEQVVPALEIIVTVAAGSPATDGAYTNELPADSFVPLIEQAGQAGQYVVLDFQPGRKNFLQQIQEYESLLRYPHVGIALDPEWRIGPHEMPLQRIGHVEIAEVNEVVTWLADYVRDKQLPQKMFMLHQFQTQMVRDIDALDTSRTELAFIVHADGQGSQGAKQGTWQTLHAYAPHIEHWGWKNFYDEDLPMLTPEQTYQVEPRPYFVSYQ